MSILQIVKAAGLCSGLDVPGSIARQDSDDVLLPHGTSDPLLTWHL